MLDPESVTTIRVQHSERGLNPNLVLPHVSKSNLLVYAVCIKNLLKCLTLTLKREVSENIGLIRYMLACFASIVIKVHHSSATKLPSSSYSK